MPADQKRGENPADKPAVNRKAALPNLGDFRQMAAVIIPLERDIVKPRAEDAADCAEQQNVKHFV